jgi:squalene cyclase
VKQLLSQQGDDGSWAQIKDRPGDALAAGQALYALAAAGVGPQEAAAQRALGSLVKTQRADGSWLVPTRVKNKSIASSFYGSGWAAIGLVNSLPNK